jgi:hypothetical protein
MPSPSFGGTKPSARSSRLEPIRVGQFPVPADEFPVRPKNSLLSEEQGIGCKLLDPFGHLLRNGPERPASYENFKNSLLFSLFSGNGVEASRRDPIDIKHILFFDVIH